MEYKPYLDNLIARYSQYRQSHSIDVKHTAAGGLAAIVLGTGLMMGCNREPKTYQAQQQEVTDQQLDAARKAYEKQLAEQKQSADAMKDLSAEAKRIEAEKINKEQADRRRADIDKKAD